MIVSKYFVGGGLWRLLNINLFIISARPLKSTFSLFWLYIYILLKLPFKGVDVVEWSRALDVRLSQWWCSESMVWVQIPSREEQNLTARKSNSNNVWFNFQTYIIFSINLVSSVTLRSNGTDILYGCHLLLDVCIIYFISCDCIIILHYPIQYIKHCWVRLLSNYNIMYHLHTLIHMSYVYP